MPKIKQAIGITLLKVMNLEARKLYVVVFATTQIANKLCCGVIEVMEMETERLGGLFDANTKHQAGSVWDKEKLSPTIDTMQGGCREPMIIDDTYTNRQTRVYEYYSPALRREREGLKTIEVKQLGFMDNGTGKHQSNTVYDEKSLCPNITTIDGGGTQQIKVMTENSVVAIDEQNMNVRTDTFGTLTTDGSSPKHNNRVMIKQATKQGYIECEVGGVADFSYPDSETRRGRVQDNGNTCPTLTAENQDICRIEMLEKPVLLGGVGE